MASTTLPVRTFEVPKNSTYSQYKAEECGLYSSKIYGNNAARMVTWLRNSQLSKSAYAPNGQVQNQGYRVLYGISLTAATMIGLAVDTIQNFLAICSIYYLGKKIWEDKNGQGAFSSASPSILDNNTSSQNASAVQVQACSPKKEDVHCKHDPRRWFAAPASYTASGDVNCEYDPDEHLIRERQENILNLLRKPYCSQQEKLALYRYLEIAPMKEIRKFHLEILANDLWDLSLYSEDINSWFPSNALQWILFLRDALSDVPLPEDPIKKYHSEVASEWAKKETELLADLANGENAVKRATYEDKKKRYQYLLDRLSNVDYLKPEPSERSLPKRGLFFAASELLDILHEEITEYWKQKETQFLSDPALNVDPEKRAEFEAEKEKFQAILEALSVRRNAALARQTDPNIIDIEPEDDSTPFSN